MSVKVIDTLKPKNDGAFPIAEAADIAVTAEKRLPEALADKADASALAETNATVAGKANASDVATATANLQGQINQIEISATAEAVVAPEVAAARVSEDGTEYSTLKERLDGVDEINQSKFGVVFDISSNLYNSSTAVDNTKLDGVGNVGEATGYFTSDFIEVNEGMQYYKSIDASNSLHRVCGYNTTKQFSSFVTINQRFIIPAGTKFIKICGSMAEKSTAVVESTTANDADARKRALAAAANAESLKSEIFTTNNFTKVSKIKGVTKTAQESANVQNGYITVFSQNGYDSYYIITDKSYTIWVDGVDTSYFAITYGLDFTGKVDGANGYSLYCSGTIARLRSTDSNLPTESNKLTVPKNTAIVFTVPHDADQTIYGFDGDHAFTSSFTTKTSEVAVDSLTELGAQKCTPNSTYDEAYDSQYADSTGMRSNDNYISWGLVIDDDTELYTQNRNNTYFSICVYDDTNFTNGVRYRALNAEDTLPYEDSPLSLTKGQYVVFSAQKVDRSFEVILSDIEVLSSFRSDIPLAATHIQQVIDSIPDKDCFLKYVQGSGSSYSTERVEVYVPTGKGYIEYEFVHSVKQEVNADIWRIAFAYACDSNFSKRYALTTAGEWECAVHLVGKSDFSGGVTHGDEVLTDDAVFFIDGAVVDISEFTDFTPFTNFIVVESSELYDPSDSVTVIAHHGSEHIFNIDGLKVNQSLLWIAAQELTSCYMAMHLPAKAITDHMYTDNSIIPFEITQYNITFPEAKKAVVYGEDSGVRSEFSIGKYPVMENGNELLLTDNGGQAYNKCYYVITTEGSITANTLWKTETNYKFDVNV